MNVPSACPSCFNESQPQLTLDCSHQLCLPCLSALLQVNEQQQMLEDQLELQCPQCQCLTVLSLSLCYKLVRDLPNTNQMICLDCLDRLFTVEEYARGSHKHHQVSTVESAFPLVRNELEVSRINLEQSLASLARESSKIIHCIAVLNATMTANLESIRGAFNRLREELVLREEQMLEEYQEGVSSQLLELNLSIGGVEEERWRGQSYLKLLSGWLSGETAGTNKTVMVEFYLNNRGKFGGVGQSQQRIRSKTLLFLEQLHKHTTVVSSEVVKSAVQTIQNIDFLKSENHHQPNKESLAKQSSQQVNLGPEYFDNKRKQLYAPFNCQPVPFKNLAQQREGKWRGGAVGLKKAVQLAKSRRV